MVAKILTTREQAFALLEDAGKCNPGPWVQHSKCVARCAEKIAAKCGMDSEKAFVLGMLHDIGRKFGVTHFAHIVDGYKYLMEFGYNEQAQICLTHSFSTQCIDDYIGEFDVSDDDKIEFTAKLNDCEYDDYDRLIQLCDSLAGVEVMEMNERMDDVARRYGYFPEKKRRANIELKEYFESIAKENIYSIVSDDKSERGL